MTSVKITIHDLEQASACTEGKASFLKRFPSGTAEVEWTRATQVDLIKSDLRKYLGWVSRLGLAPPLDFSGADLRHAYLRHAYLNGADLRHAYLRGADLRHAYLRGADLSGADLRHAYLRGADLSGADLSGANLHYAYLSGADLSGANLSGADLRCTWGLK